jgi:hypothetical protein
MHQHGILTIDSVVNSFKFTVTFELFTPAFNPALKNGWADIVAENDIKNIKTSNFLMANNLIHKRTKHFIKYNPSLNFLNGFILIQILIKSIAVPYFTLKNKNFKL